MVAEGGITKQMALKCAGTGLRLEHLNLAFSSNGREGLVQLLEEKSNTTQVWVTKCSTVIDKIDKYVCSFV
jgi:hypothetical protein